MTERGMSGGIRSQLSGLRRRAAEWNWSPDRVTASGLPRILSGLLIMMLVWGVTWPLVIRYILLPEAGWSNPQIGVSFAFALGVLGAMLLNRNGRYLAAASAAVGLLLVSTFLAMTATVSGAMEPVFARNDPSLLIYLVLPVALSAALLPPILVIAVFACSVGAVLSVPLLYAEVSWSGIVYGPLLYLAVVSGLLVFISALLGIQQRRSYRELQHREERYRSLFEQSPDAVFLVSQDGIVEGLNRAGLELFGYVAGELEGRHVREVYANPDDRAAVVSKTQRQGSLVDEPLRMRKKDGSVIDCLVTIWLRRDTSGRVTGYQTVVRDVTGRIRGEEELRLKGQLLDLAHDVVLLTEPGGEIEYANEASATLTGYPLGELVGMNVRHLNTREEAEQLPARTSMMLREGHLEYETVWVCRDGREVNVEVRGRTVESRGRTLLLGVIRDVSRRKADEAQLRLRGQLLDAAHDSVFLYDLSGRFIYVNQSAARSRGYTREALLAMSVRDLLLPEDAARHRAQLMGTGERATVTSEMAHVCKDGSLLPVEVSRRVIESGGTLYVLAIARDIRERKQAETALRESEEKYRSLYEQSMDAISTSGPDGSGLEANSAWLALFGYTKDELSALNFVDIYVDLAERDRFLEAVKDTDSVKDEVHLRRKDGSEFVCERTVVARRDARGNIVLFQGVFHDVTEQRRIELALRQSEEKFRALFERSMDAVCLVSVEGTLLEANQAFLALFGLSSADVGELDISVLYSDPAGRDDYIQRLRQDGSVMDFEFRLQKRDGTLMDCVLNSVAYRNADGRIVAAQSVIRNVTESKKAQSLLRESEARYRALFEQSVDAAWTLLPDGTGHHVNQSWLDIFGYSKEEAATLNAIDLYLHPSEREDFLRRITESGLVRDEVWLKRKDGSAFVCQRAVVARKDETGLIVEYHGVARDVTERKKAESLLRESEEKYRTLFEHSMDAIYVVAPGGEYIAANQAWLDLFGYTDEDLAVLNAADAYVDPCDRALFLEHIAQTGFVRDEIRFRKKDGTVFDCERAVVAIRDISGALISCQGVMRDVSERKKADNLLRESEAKYRTLFEQTRDAIYIATPDGTSLDVNQAWLDMLGYTFEEMMTLGANDIYADPSSRDAYVKRLEQAGFVHDDPCQLRKKDGTVIDCLRTVTIRRDAAGNSIAYQGVVRDITEQNRAEQELRQSEEKYRSLFEHSMDAVALVSVDGTLLDANPAYLKLFGHTADAIGQKVSHTHYSNAAVRDEMLRLLNRDGVIIDQEVRMKKADGIEMDCIRSIVARRDSNGRFIALQSVTRDITERRRIEQELRSNELRLDQLARLSRTYTWEVDLDGFYTYVSPAVEEVIGYKPEELVGKVRFHQLSREAEQGRTMEFESQMLLSGEKFTDFENVVVRKDGHAVWCSSTGMPLLDAHGKLVGYRGWDVDINERKVTELELLRSREELQRSAEQLHELTSYLEEARETERTGIARELHDQLGQALTALSMDLGGLRRAATSGETIPADRVDRMAALLDETVNDVRRISSELRPGILDDGGLVAAIEWQLDRFRERSGIDCSLETRADDAGLGRAQSTALFRVFQELLTNIARHAGASRVRVVFERDNSDCILSVSDNGRGMTEEQANSTASLGIVGVRERLRPLHGSIQFLRRRPKGTTVRVQVPVE